MSDRLRLTRLGMATQLAEEVARQIDGAGGADEVKEAPYVPFASRSDAEASDIPAPLLRIQIGGLRYVRDASGTALTTADGSTWAPDGSEAQPEHWGLTGAEADSVPAYQLAINWLAVDPARKLVDRYTGTRVFGSTMTTTGHVNIDIGAATYLVAHSSRWLDARGNDGAVIVPLAADYVIGGRSLQVSLPQIPARGSWIRIASDAVNPNDRDYTTANKYRMQDFVKVGEGSTVTTVALASPIRFTDGVNDDRTAIVNAYSVAQGARAAIFDTSLRFRITGGTFTHPAGGTGVNNLIRIRAYYRPVIEGVSFASNLNTSIYLNGTMKARIAQCRFENSDFYSYPICDGGHYTVVEDCDFGFCRHGYTTLRTTLPVGSAEIYNGGNTVGAVVSRCNAWENDAVPFNTHHGSVDCTFVDCYSEGPCDIAFGGRGIGHKVDRCRCFGADIAFRAIIESGNNIGGGQAALIDKYSSEWTVSNCDFHALNEGVYARNSRVTLRDCSVRVENARLLSAENSILTLEGANRLSAVARVGSANSGTNVMASLSVVAGQTAFGAASTLTLLPGSTLTMDCTGLGQTPMQVFGVDGSSTARLWGTIRVNMTADGTMAVHAASRFPTRPSSALEVMGASTGFSLGTLSGKFVAYRSDGTTFT